MRPWRKASIFPLVIAVSDMSTRVTTPLFTVTLKMKTTPEMVEQSCGKNVLNDTVEPVYHSVLPFLWSSSSCALSLGLSPAFVPMSFLHNLSALTDAQWVSPRHIYWLRVIFTFKHSLEICKQCSLANWMVKRQTKPSLCGCDCTTWMGWLMHF